MREFNIKLVYVHRLKIGANKYATGMTVSNVPQSTLQAIEDNLFNNPDCDFLYIGDTILPKSRIGSIQVTEL